MFLLRVHLVDLPLPLECGVCGGYEGCEGYEASLVHCSHLLVVWLTWVLRKGWWWWWWWWNTEAVRRWRWWW